MQPQCKLFFVEPFDTILRPFVITTAYTNSRGDMRAEWFIVIPDGDATKLFAKVTWFDAQSFAGSPVILDETFMLQEVYEQAQKKLRQYLFAKHQGRRLVEFSGTLQLIETELKALVHYTLHRDCFEQIYGIKHKTACQPLQSFLEAIGSLQLSNCRDL